jgi:hypothetical protein
MPTIRLNKNSASSTGNTSTNRNTINVKVVVGDTKKKKPARKRSSPSTSDDSSAPPPPTVVQNYIQPSSQPQGPAISYAENPPLPRTGGSMFNRPYDVADAGVGTENEAVPEGLASNFAAMEERRQRVIQDLYRQLDDQMVWSDTTANTPAGPGSVTSDLTIAPSSAAPSIQHGAQIDNGDQWYTNDSFEMPHVTPDNIQFPEDDPEALPVRHRSMTFALPPAQATLALPSTQATLALPAPPTQSTEEITPSVLPEQAGPSRGRGRGRTSTRGRGSAGRVPSQAAYRASMIADGWLSGSQRTTQARREEYENWINTGRHANVRPSWESSDK